MLSQEFLKVLRPAEKTFPAALIDLLAQYDRQLSHIDSCGYSSFVDKAGLICLTVEELHALGLITGGEYLFDTRGYLSAEIGPEQFQRARQEEILSGLRIINVGGIEAIPLRLFGAEVAFIDSGLEHTSFPEFFSRLSKMRFVTERLGDENAGKLGVTADVVMSSLLFSRGSGMVESPHCRYDAPFDDPELSLYKKYLRLMLSLTRPGGINIHDGEVMPHLVDRVKDVAILSRVYRAHSVDPKFYHNVMDDLFVFQKQE